MCVDTDRGTMTCSVSVIYSDTVTCSVTMICSVKIKPALSQNDLLHHNDLFLHSDLLCHSDLEDVPLVEFMYLVFTRMPGERYLRQLGVSVAVLV